MSDTSIPKAAISPMLECKTPLPNAARRVQRNLELSRTVHPMASGNARGYAKSELWSRRGLPELQAGKCHENLSRGTHRSFDRASTLFARLDPMSSPHDA